MHVGGFPGASRPFQGLQGPFQGLQASKSFRARPQINEKCVRDGQAGLGHPPWRGGGLGSAQAKACLQGSRGGFERDLNALRLDASANLLGASRVGLGFRI